VVGVLERGGSESRDERGKLVDVRHFVLILEDFLTCY
jgi:hypothetical protein